MKQYFPGIVFAILCASGSIDVYARSGYELTNALAEQLARTAPAADPGVIELGTHALACAKSVGAVADTHTLAVIDYSRPSTLPRLWVFDLERKALLFEEWVAHGRNTGANVAVKFSNDAGSLMSSIGAFVTADTYEGHNGYSLRLKGLDPGFNDNALARAIVFHGASYVSANLIQDQGRIGRSFGCPAVRPEVAHRLIDAIRDGAFVFAYYPDPDWMTKSRYLGDCGDEAPTSVDAGLARREIGSLASRAHGR